MSRIEFGELRIGKIAEDHLKDVIKNNWASGGPKVKLFEEELARIFGARHAAAVSSGTDADINACLVTYELGAKRGKSEVIVPALSFIATANSIRAAGLVPRFVDIKPETLNIDEDKIEDAINENTVAIMAVNTMGKPCNYVKIRYLCEKYKLLLIIDNCEGHGCQYNGMHMETIGDICTYSFYIAHLICCGEGGAVTTNQQWIDSIIRSTRSHGRYQGDLYFNHVRTGLNSKMNDMEASIGLEGISNYYTTFNSRHSTMKSINSYLRRYDHIWISDENKADVNCPHGISITFKKPTLKQNVGLLQQALDKADIHWKRNFGCIPTQHKAFEDMGHKLGDFPYAEHVGDHGIHIGCHQYLTEDNVKHIIATLTRILE